MRFPLRVPPYALLTLVTAALVAAWLAFPGQARAADPEPTIYIDGKRDTAHYVPGSTQLGRVGDRTFTVMDFRIGYFQNMADQNPGLDSTSRAGFLANMVRKETLGQVALRAGYSLKFEERSTLEEFRRTTLVNRLFARPVGEPVLVPDDSLEHMTRFFDYDQKLRILVFRDKGEAERIRGQILRGTLPWSVAAVRYAPHNTGGADAHGELNWMRFEALPLDVSARLWALSPGAISPVIQGQSGFQLVQVLQRRPRAAPDHRGLMRYLRIQVTNLQRDFRHAFVLRQAVERAHLVFDSTTVAWAAAHFLPASSSESQGLVSSLSFDENLPDFTDADLLKTLATWSGGGRMTLGELVHKYSEIPVIMRPNIDTADRLSDFATGIICEPQLIEIAVARGLDRDTMVVTQLARKTEELLVTRMVEDSVFSHVTVSEAERHAYYESHRSDFTTFPSLHYAIIVRHSRESADSVKRALDAGASELAIVHADSLAGNTRSGIVLLSDRDPSPVHKLLFEEMRPGQTRLMNPDRLKNSAVLKLLDYDPGQLIPYGKVQGAIDDAVRNVKAERGLNELCDRLSKRFTIETHPELLMRIKPTTVSSDDMH